MSCFKLFYLFYGLQQNKSKCEVTEIRNLKGVKLAVYGMECIYLSKKAVKISEFTSGVTLKMSKTV